MKDSTGFGGKFNWVHKRNLKLYNFSKNFPSPVNKLFWIGVRFLRKIFPPFNKWFEKNSVVIATGQTENVITNIGLAQFIKRITGQTANAFTYLAYGDDSTAPANTDTALVNELARAAATVTATTTYVTNDTARLSKTFSITATQTIRECGVFDASTGGNCGARALVSPERAVVNGDSFTLNYDLIARRKTD